MRGQFSPVCRCSPHTLSHCITFPGCFPASFLLIPASSSHSGTSSEDSPVEPPNPGAQTGGAHWGRASGGESPRPPLQEDTCEQMLQAELPWPPPLSTDVAQRLGQRRGEGAWLTEEGGQSGEKGWPQPGRKEGCQMLADILLGRSA